MNEEQKEIQSLRRKTLHLQITLGALIVNLLLITVGQVKSYAVTHDYYQRIQKQIEMNSKAIGLLVEQGSIDNDIYQQICEILKRHSEILQSAEGSQPSSF